MKTTFEVYTILYVNTDVNDFKFFKYVDRLY